MNHPVLNPYVIRLLKIIFICFSLCFLFACAAKEETMVSRGMQNLTAKYNYIYNARIILDHYKANLPQYVSTDPAGNTEVLDKVIHKAETVISEKSFSKYKTDAYLLLGEAHFLKGNYFLAKEYFHYIVNNYSNDLPAYTMALDGTARSLMQLDSLVQAAPFLDSLEVNLPKVKKHKAAYLATLAQSKIANKDNVAAIAYLEAALKSGVNRQEGNRWTFLLAQLYETEKNHPLALRYFKKAEKQNRISTPLPVHAVNYATGPQNPDVTNFLPDSPKPDTTATKEPNQKTAARKAFYVQKYKAVYEAFEKKNYQQVIEDVKHLSIDDSLNAYAPRFAYLNALAIGRTSSVDSLIVAFQNSSHLFDQDPQIGPLVKRHLTYIHQHLPQFKSRPIALIPTHQRPTLAQGLQETQLKALPLPAAKKVDSLVIAVKKPMVAKDIFSTGPANAYYFVIAVNDASVTLTSSRFGIGQFNRGNYAESALKHRLTEFDNDQLIYVGNFSNFENVKLYADEIIPKLQQIMKVPVNSYKSFIISKENFELINNKELLNKYLEFYKNNF